MYIDYNQAMNKYAHIFTPRDDSLAERIRAYRSVLNAQRHTEAGFKFLDDPQWSDRIGEESELQEALAVTTRSFKKAISSVGKEEIEQAFSDGLINAEEHKQIVQIMRKQDMQTSRAQAKQAGKSHSEKQK